MEITAVALPFLILAAAIGPPAHGAGPGGGILSLSPGVHRPGDCCLSYTSRDMRCTLMKDYFVTTSGCLQPGVIFKTHRGQEVCFHPSANGVEECMKKLALANTRKPLVEGNEH